MFYEDRDLLPPNLVEKRYKYVGKLSVDELLDIGNLHGFFSTGIVSPDNILQFKALEAKQTVSIYVKTSTVRLQPGGKMYDRETIRNCNAKELALMMLEVQVVEPHLEARS